MSKGVPIPKEWRPLLPQEIWNDLELVKPAGLHFVEEQSCVTNLFYPEIPVKYMSLPVQLSNTRLFPSYTRLSHPIHIFPCPLPYSYEAYESVVGHVSRICQRVSSRTASHRVLDWIRIKMKWEIRKLSWKRRLRRK